MTTLNKNQKQEIEEFFEILEKVSSPSDIREPNKLVYDLGLIILENKIDPKEIFNLLTPGKARYFELDNPYVYDDFFRELVIANREGQWFFVNLQVDPAPTIIGILKQLSEDNSFTISHFEDEEFFRMNLNPKTRIIFCIESDFLETKITYPFFLNLFGPILRI